MIYFYIIMLIISIINLTIFIIIQSKRSNAYMMILFVMAAVANWGYLELALAGDLETAILAQKIVYIGAVYIVECILLLNIQICNYKLHRMAHLILYFVPLLVLILVSSIGYSDLYYKSVELINKNGVSALKKEYGPMHSLYYVILYGYMIMSISLVIYAIIKKKRVSFKNMVLLATIEIVGISAYLIGKMIDSSIEVMPIVYVLYEFVLLYIFRRISMYDIEYNVVSSMEQKSANGYILLKKNMTYIGSNEVVRKKFKELEKLRIDFPLIHEKGSILDEIFKWVEELDSDDEKEMISKEYKERDKHYQCNVKYLYYMEKSCGYIIEVIDDTTKQNYIELLNSYNTELVEEVEEKTSHIVAIQNKILFTMSNMVENRDNNTGGHINRTSYVVKILLDKMKEDKTLDMKPSFCNTVVKSAPMHDLGKITIDDRILRKPGKLTNEEYDIMKGHSEAGAKIVEKILEDVEDIDFIKIAVNIAKYHHEKWDGTGYPEQLSNEDIPLEARIMAIADVYDALVSERCYKEKMSFKEANKVIIESMGSHFDPSLKKYFEMARPELEEFYQSQEP